MLSVASGIQVSLHLHATTGAGLDQFMGIGVFDQAHRVATARLT